MLYRFIHPIVNRLARVVADVTITGAERMPRGMGVLVVSNHLTNYDPLIISMCFKRELHYMAKVELYRHPLIGWLISHLNAFPVRRGEADRTALRRAEELLHSGRVVALFPEGHRARDAAVQPSKGGIALLARRANVPILPVAITGTQYLLPEALPRWRPWRRPAVTVTVGTPFTLPPSTGRADYNALANLIMGHVAELLPPSYRGVFAQETRVSAERARAQP
jgi:1-acyl-sn-glycerol-3-phosphate acyltransferase